MLKASSLRKNENMLRAQPVSFRTFERTASRSILNPGEMENLVGNPDYEKVLSEHRNLFAKYKKESGDTFLR
ncbi:hypothetical protein ES703_12148 [subsurface metagenome]